MKSLIGLLMVILLFLISCQPADVEDANITITNTMEPSAPEAEEQDAGPVEQDEPADDADDQGETDDGENGQDDADEEVGEDSEEQDSEEPFEIIQIENLKFKPDEMTIEAGTRVRWIHKDMYQDNDKIVHQIGIYKRGEPFYERSDRMFYDDSFEYIFEEPGEYWYVDIVFIDRMRGEITVEQ